MTVLLVEDDIELVRSLVVTRKMLLENVWGIHFDPHTSVVESHVSRLRSRLSHGFGTDVIRTARGLGYQLLVRA